MITFDKIEEGIYVIYNPQGINDVITDYKVTGVHKGMFSKWVQENLLYPSMLNVEKELHQFKQEQSTKRNINE